MVDCETKVSADGRDTKKCLTVCCLEENALQDSFVVSKSVDDQAFTVYNPIVINAADACRIPSSKLDKKPILSIESNPSKERVVSVTFSKSSVYGVAKYVSYQIHITVNALKNFVYTAVRRLRRTFENMKGKQQSCRVYTLCLLRL